MGKSKKQVIYKAGLRLNYLKVKYGLIPNERHNPFICSTKECLQNAHVPNLPDPNGTTILARV